MWHFLSLLRVHFVWSVNVWKALKRCFSERTAACQKNHGGSLAGAFDLICRSAVMLWHFRHNSGSGQTNHLWYGKLAHFTFYLLRPSLTRKACRPDNNNTSSYWTALLLFISLPLFPSFIILLLFLSISFQCGGLEASITSSQIWDVWAKPLCHQLY